MDNRDTKIADQLVNDIVNDKKLLESLESIKNTSDTNESHTTIQSANNPAMNFANTQSNFSQQNLASDNFCNFPMPPLQGYNQALSFPNFYPNGYPSIVPPMMKELFAAPPMNSLTAKPAQINFSNFKNLSKPNYGDNQTYTQPKVYSRNKKSFSSLDSHNPLSFEENLNALEDMRKRRMDAIEKNLSAGYNAHRNPEFNSARYTEASPSENSFQRADKRFDEGTSYRKSPKDDLKWQGRHKERDESRESRRHKRDRDRRSQRNEQKNYDRGNDRVDDREAKRRRKDSEQTNHRDRRERRYRRDHGSYERERKHRKD